MQSLSRNLIGRVHNISSCFSSTRLHSLTTPVAEESSSSRILHFCSLHNLSSFSPRQADRQLMSSLSAAKAEGNISTSELGEVFQSPRIKFKRLDKTAKHIMQILDKEAVEEVKAQREIPDIRPGYIVKLKMEVPENKRRNTTVEGVVIARRNAGLNSTFRLRRIVAGVGYEYLFPLYSPNIKEIQVLDKKRVRRAKLYYLRDKMSALKRR